MRDKNHHPIVQFICSIRFTIFLLVTLAAILAVATVIESREGTGAVQNKVYRAAWFNFFLVGFTLNMLGGTYKRFRLLWVHFGFAVTHVGVFTILLGAFLTRNFGIEGQMTIPDAATREYFIGNEDNLSVTAEKGEDKTTLPVPIERGSKQRDLWVAGKLPISGIRVAVDRYYPDLQFEPEVAPAPAGPPALHYRVEAMGADAGSWLVAGAPGRDSIEMGPLQVRFQTLEGELPPEEAQAPATPSMLVFTGGANKETVKVPVTPGATTPLEIGGKKFSVTVKQTFDNFTMDGKDFQDRPGAPDNPAVAFVVEGAEGKLPDIVFAKYPDFSLQHSRKDPGYRVRYEFSGSASAAKNRLSFYWSAAKGLQYALRMGGKRTGAGKVEVGKPLSLMHGRFQVSVDQLLPASRMTQKASNGGDEARNPSLHAKLIPASGEGVGVWVPWGEPRTVDVGGQKYTLIYRGERFELPFSLQLLKFKEEKYPGSNQSASYESRVTLRDSQEGKNEEILISMNEPLLYRGYTFFQSSFIPGDTYTTILSVSRDPGKWPTYIGYLMMTGGLILMFYMKPIMARWDQARLKKQKETPS